MWDVERVVPGVRREAELPLDWFHNVFNRRAAELYDEYGLDFFREIRRRLPWMRYELWTTDSLLRALEEIAPGFLAWTEELEYLAPRR